ncbi:serine/threonine-protein phosphatase 2A 55 kDa regulatory subunit B beta isoform 3-T3 [Lycaon pictus]|nr:serine/threonine-protein phosphatase 2A 55 kDa regulatory subunit B beta isoform isoform X2 [Canis lupus familiaris]XP_025303461.1 serine/threonine-protein phosphatase 2A 55 kDa regulatory subunit B beta isoform isoform X2 [Canis lupus dingo]XP_038386457.1 serine/threonine-protein phosphatase 2A 55 kDa regulatory subunit B beta isoform isoform X2 [Canis lupus familiaris]XP_038514747.1 serine/threonine-protein phosphatase 2A 55 kDa regulatory subunit B beta isoform isoform X2 [Canis lupus fami|eukprot:XP_003433828.1 serine/threonine-protein phosphatase 2A 55 kDa regulatory subunit B beta isoform isoform X2 [Canis lupus familiaris]
MVLQPSERHHRDRSHRRLGPWCSPSGSPAPLSCETGCGEGSWILVCRLLVPTQVSLLSMEEDIDTRKINNSFLRDHSYATEADIISTVEFNHTGELLATGDKGGRVVIFQREQESKNQVHRRGEYNVYSTFQSHEPEFDYLKSLEIEEKINKIRWLPQQNAAYFLLSTNDKTVKLWKVSERDKRPEGYNLKDEEGRLRDPATITTLRVPVLRPMDLMVEATPRRVFANAHTYHINSISVNSDYETYMSADDLRINLWNFEITNQSFNIVDIKPANMEELTEVITAAEFHPHHCNSFVYSSSKGTIRLCDMRASALCDRHSKFFEEPEDPSNRSFFSEIISSISDVKFSHSGRYIMTRDYLTVKVWDLNMENRPIETYQVHDYLRSKLCSLYENDCIFDKFECVWNGSDSVIMTGSYNNFFRMFDRNTKRDVTLEASRENSKPRAILKPRKVCVGGKRRKDEISVDSLDFSKKILHTAWHPSENIIAVAATNNLYIFQDKVN